MYFEVKQQRSSVETVMEEREGKQEAEGRRGQKKRRVRRRRRRGRTGKDVTTCQSSKIRIVHSSEKPKEQKELE